MIGKRKVHGDWRMDVQSNGFGSMLGEQTWGKHGLVPVKCMRSLFCIMTIVFVYTILHFGRKQIHWTDPAPPQEVSQKCQRPIKQWAYQQSIACQAEECVVSRSPARSTIKSSPILGMAALLSTPTSPTDQAHSRLHLWSHQASRGLLLKQLLCQPAGIAYVYI